MGCRWGARVGEVEFVWKGMRECCVWRGEMVRQVCWVAIRLSSQHAWEEVHSRKSCGESLENSKRAATAQFEHRSSHKIDMAAKAQHMKNPTFTLHCPF